MRRLHGQWWELVREQDELSAAEAACLDRHAAFFREIETTNMTKCFKAVLLESLQDHDGFRHPPLVGDLAVQALDVFRRRRRFIPDIRNDLQDIENIDATKWRSYWLGNPVNAWTGGNRTSHAKPWFELREGRFQPTFEIQRDEIATFHAMVQELVDYRLAAYEPRLALPTPHDAAELAPALTEVLPFPKPAANDDTGTDIPYFADLRIACGHFRNARTDVVSTFRVPPGHGNIDPDRHFVARATGNSMNGGKHPVQDGDYLLLELVDPSKAGAITGSIMAVERQGITGDDQYVLRLVTKDSEGSYRLKAANPSYADFEVNEDMRPLARFRGVLDPPE